MTLDPDRRIPAPRHPGFDPREIDVDMDVCRWCGALVPASERERTKHEDWERLIASRFLTLFDRLPGASPPVTAGDPPAGTTRPPEPATQATSPAGEGGPGGRKDAGGGVEGAGDDVRPAPTGYPDDASRLEQGRRLARYEGRPEPEAITWTRVEGSADPEQADLLAYETTLTDQEEP